jgi:hypothetical protein
MCLTIARFCLRPDSMNYLAYSFASFFLLLQIVFFIVSRRAIHEVLDEWQIDVRSPANSMLSGIDLLKGLDHRFLTHRYCEFLRRLGTTAPLVGVMISALTLLGSSDAVGPEAGIRPLALLRELYVGVLIGVSLAIVNQLLLALLYRSFHLRRQLVDLQNVNASLAARVSAATGDLKQEIDNATVGLQRGFAAAMDECARLVSLTQERLGRENQKLSEVVASTLGVQKHVATFMEETFPSRMDQAIGITLQRLSQAFGKLEVAVALQVQEVSKAVIQCGEIQARAQLSVPKSVDSTAAIGNVIDGLKNSAGSLTAGIAEFSRVALPKLKGELQHLADDSRSIVGALGHLPRVVDESLRSYSETLASSADLGESLANAGLTLEKASHRFESMASNSSLAVAQAVSIVEKNLNHGTLPLVRQLDRSLTATADTAGKCVESLDRAVKPLTVSLEGVDRMLRSVTPVSEDLTGAIRDLQTGVEYLVSATEMHAGTMERIRGAADAFPGRIESQVASAIEQSFAGMSAMITRTEKVMGAMDALVNRLNTLGNPVIQVPSSRRGWLRVWGQ